MKKYIAIFLAGSTCFGAGYFTSVAIYDAEYREMENYYYGKAERLYGYNQEEMDRFTGRIADLMGPEEAAEMLEGMKSLGPEYAILQMASRTLATLASAKYYKILEERDVAVLRRHIYYDVQQFYDYFADLSDETPSGSVEENLHSVMKITRDTVADFESKYDIETGEPINAPNGEKPVVEKLLP